MKIDDYDIFAKYVVTGELDFPDLNCIQNMCEIANTFTLNCKMYTFCRPRSDSTV